MTRPVVAAAAAILACTAGTAVAGRYIITSTGQIKPSVRASLRGHPGVGTLVVVQSPEVTMAPGQTSYDANPLGLEADCPRGYAVVGTGADTGIGNLDFVLSYGTFVGGFVDNDTSIPISASVQAICAKGDAVGARSAVGHERFRTDQARAQRVSR